MKEFKHFEKLSLTPSQIEAIKIIDRPVLVIAVAGSGKTRVITEKIKYLLENDYRPESIVGITFTNKAANEMKERVGEFYSFALPYVTTIHSFCLKLLKEYSDLFKIKKDFLVADEELQISIIKEILKKESILNKYSPKNIRHSLSLIKIKINQDLTGLIKIFGTYKKAINFYNTYQKYLSDNNLLDFGDLILKVVETLKLNEEIKLFFQNKFKYFLIDEYQDTNQIQRDLLKLLVDQNNITAVGDEDQSIYSFRGSDVTNIMNFEKDFKNAKIIFMETNFRSNINILNIANEIIKKNKFRREKKLIPFKKNNGEVYLFVEYNEKSEAKRAINIIKNNIKNGYNYNDIAILYRANWQSAYIEQYLFKNHIPYKIFHGMSFYRRKEIKIIFNFIGYILNPDSFILFKSIINIPKKGIGIKTINNVHKEFQISEYNSLIEFLLNYKNGKIKNFAFKIYKLKSIKSPSKLIEMLIEEFNLMEYFKDDEDSKIEERKENLNQLIKISREFELESNKKSKVSSDPVLEFYNQFMLYANENPLNIKGVNLLTLHSAKGLEFKIVIIIGVVDGIIPMIKIDDDSEFYKNLNIKNIIKKKIEEERRLFYVGITRAKEKLYFISYHNSINYYGYENRIKNISQFLINIPEFYFTAISIPSQNHNFEKNNLLNTPNLFSDTTIDNEFINLNYNNQKSYSNSKIYKNKDYNKDNDSNYSIYNYKENNDSSNHNFNKKNEVEQSVFKVDDKVFIKNYGKGTIIEIKNLNKLTRIKIKMENGNEMTFIKEYANIYKI